MRSEYFLFGFPCHTEYDIKNVIFPLCLPQNEKEIYLSYTSKVRINQFVLPFLGIIVVLKNVYHFNYVITALNGLHDPVSSKRNSQIGCLTTNCTSKEELYALPVFSLCKPHLRMFHTPLIDLHNFGILFLSIVTLYVFLIGVVLIIYTHLSPRTSETFMFALCPISIKNANRYWARRYLLDTYYSLINYTYIRSRPLSLNSVAVFDNATLKYQQTQLNILSTTVTGAVGRLHELKDDYYNLSRTMRDFVDDCVALVRSYIWQPQLKIRLVITAIVVFTIILFAFIGILYLFWILMLDRKKKFDWLDESFKSKKCSIWNVNLTDIADQVLKVSDVTPRWQLLGLFEVAVVLMPVGVISTLNVVSFYVVVDDIKCYLREMIVRAQIVVNLTEVFKEVERCDSNHLLKNANANYSFEPVRRLLYRQFTRQEEANVNWTNLNELTYQYLVSEGIHMDSYCDMLTKIYVSIRLVMSQFKKESKAMCEVLVFISVFNFFTIILMLFYNKLFDETSFLPICIVVTLVSTSSALIIRATVLQAESRILMSKIWKLIAITYDMEHIRVKHMRVLLVKELEVLAQSDGLRLAAHGVTITNATIIKLVLWSSTLIVLSFG